MYQLTDLKYTAALRFCKRWEISPLETTVVKDESIRIERCYVSSWAIVPDTSKFDVWKQNFKKVSEYWQLLFLLMQYIPVISKWLEYSKENNFLLWKRSWEEVSLIFDDGNLKKDLKTFDM
jgi:hypothetical protein